jgi:hypothetical protein
MEREMTCVHTSTADCYRQKEEDKDERNGTERREGKGDAETAGFVYRYPAPVVERELMTTW